MEVVMKAKLKLAAFWMQVQQTKESLIQFDEGYYQQVPATHPHTRHTETLGARITNEVCGLV